MEVEAWLAAAQADADRRGLSELKPMLAALAAATKALRAGLSEKEKNGRVDR
jgi:hypothetical protein